MNLGERIATTPQVANDDRQRPGLADAAGRAAFYSARTAARAWRGPLEEAVDEVPSAPEIARSSTARSQVRCPRRSHDRSCATESSSASPPSSQQAGTGASCHRGAREPSDARAHRQSAGKRRDATRRPPRRLKPRAPRRDRAADAGLAEEVVGGVRASAAGLDDRAERVVRRRVEPTTGDAGIATRAIALATDAALTLVLRWR